MTQTSDHVVSYFQVHWDISGRRKYGSKKYYLIMCLRYTLMSSCKPQRVIYFFFSRASFWINSASYEYMERSANNSRNWYP